LVSSSITRKVAAAATRDGSSIATRMPAAARSTRRTSPLRVSVTGTLLIVKRSPPTSPRASMPSRWTALISSATRVASVSSERIVASSTCSRKPSRPPSSPLPMPATSCGSLP